MIYLRSRFVLWPNSCNVTQRPFRVPSRECVSHAAYSLSTSDCSSFSLLFPLRRLRLMDRNPNQRIRQLSRLTIHLTTIAILSRLRNPR